MGQRSVHRRRRGWAWMTLLPLLLPAGCGQDGSTAAVVGEMKAEELLAQLKLTGMARDEATEWALFLLALPGKPTEHLKLKAGQQLGDLEVLSIDPAAQAVDVRLGDQIATLSVATDGLKPEDGYAWLQRLTPDEHARLYNSPARQSFVDDHSQAQEQRQREEMARALPEPEQLLQPSPGEQPADPN